MIKFYRAYQSLKKYGREETEGIELGKSYVFPKIDGTNSSVWFDGESIQAGSRRRQLSLENDNAGFYRDNIGDERLLSFFTKYPDIRLYGEWLVPHSLKTYRKDAWRKFYVFDVVKELDPENGSEDSEFIYLSYDQYQPMLEEFGIDYINPIGVVKNATEDKYFHYLNNNGFLIEDGCGNGEGVVIKNYDYKNPFGQIIWAKIVTNEFKEKHFRAMGAPQVDVIPIEEKIVEEFLTEALIEKEYSKILHDVGGEWNNKLIPRLLNVAYYCLVTEELWDALKKYKNPKLNFKALQSFAFAKVKRVKSELF